MANKIHLFIIHSLLFFINLCLSQVSQWQSIGPEGVSYKSDIYINPLSPEIAYVCGSGQIYKTTTSGNYWYSVTPEGLSTEQPSRIVFNQQNPSEIYLLNKKVYFSNDGGENWNLFYTDETFTIIYINNLNPDSMIAMKYNRLYQTSDGGQNWDEITFNFNFSGGFTTFWLNPFFPENIVAYKIITNGGDVVIDHKTFLTNNSGETWDSTDAGFDIQDVVFDPYNPNSIYVRKYNSLIKTSDFGHKWIEIGDTLTEGFYDLVIDPNNSDVLYLIKSKNHTTQNVYTSGDGGNAWSLYHQFLPSVNISSFTISSANSNIIYVASYPLGVLYTANNGSKWQERSTGLDLNSADYVKTGLDNTIYAGIPYRGILRSRDNGISWETIYADYSTTPNNLVISKTNPSHIFLLNYSYPDFAISYSSNNGDKWNQSTFHPLDLFGFDVAPDNQTVYSSVMVGNNGSLLLCSVAKSVNLGETWDILDIELPVLNENTYINFVDNIKTDWNDTKIVYAEAWIRGDSSNNVLIRTMDGGNSWNIISDFSQYYLNPYLKNTIYVLNNSELYKSTDNGDHWQNINQITDPDDWVLDLEVDPLKNNTLYVSTYKNGVLKSPDEGKTWQPLLEKKNIFINDLASRIIDSVHTMLYAATNNFSVQSLVINHGITSIRNSDFDVVKTPVLFNNYPNPFNPVTSIVYQIPIPGTVELSIYNLLGQKIATLVSGKQTAGYHQIEWDASQFSSGVYYYILIADDYSEVKKMILLK